MFKRDIHAWARYAEIVDDPAKGDSNTVFTRDRVQREREAAELREAVANAQRHARAHLRVAEIDEADKADAARRTVQAQRDYEKSIRQAIPGGMKYRLTSHARDRAEERNIDLYKLFQAAAHPGERHAQPWRGPHIAVHQRDDVRAIVNENTGAIITVMDPGAPDETAESFAAREALNSRERIAL